MDIPDETDKNSTPGIETPSNVDESRAESNEVDLAEERLSVSIKCDRYGFMQDDKRWIALDLDDKARKISVRKERDRTKKWVKMIKSWDRYVFLKHDKLKSRIRKGIPDSVRGVVWPLLINVRHWQTKYPGAYSLDKMPLVASNIRDDITKDLNRTYPRHELFANNGFGQSSLERVLVMYAAHDPDANYCQGMGFIAGMFLMYMDEENALYCMIGSLEVHSLLLILN